MNKYTINREELINHLKDQIDFIVASAISFDKGFEGEAKRLATVIRILVHDTSKSSALLTQLNEMSILFYDSANNFDPNNYLTSHCLTMIRLSKEEGHEPSGDYIAPLDDLSPARSKDKKVSFDRWWRRNTVFKDKEGNIFNRKDMVLNVANKEGGAHIDPKLDQTYANLTKFNSLAWKIQIKSETKDMGNPVPPAIRQITHEVIKTLRDGVTDLFTDKEIILKSFEKYEKHCLLRSKGLGFKQQEAHHAIS